MTKLKESNFHIYPCFRFVFRKYFLADYPRHPEDADADEIYGLVNEVKANFTHVSSPRREIGGEQKDALRLYPTLAAELEHITLKREAYLAKVNSTKTVLFERGRQLEFYTEEKRAQESYMKYRQTARVRELPYPLPECPICANHFLFEEFCTCKGEGHLVCKYCLRLDITTNYLPRGIATVRCMSGGDDCTAGYTNQMIKKAIGVGKKYTRLEEIATFIDLNAFGEEPNIYGCPFCPYRFFSETKPQIVHCENRTCRKVTCLLCNKEQSSHPGGECPVLRQQRLENERVAREFEEEDLQAEDQRVRRLIQQADDDRRYCEMVVEEERNEERARQMRQAEEQRRLQRAAEEEAAAAQRRAEQERRRAKDLAESLRIYVTSKMDEVLVMKCSRCGKRIVRDGGCDHITCVCGNEWHEVPEETRVQQVKRAAEAEWRAAHPEGRDIPLVLDFVEARH